MGLLSRAKSLCRNLLHRPRVEAELDEEIRGFVEALTEEKMARGVAAAEARRQALVECGGVEQVKQAVRDGLTGVQLELWWQDVRSALRQLKRNRAFAWTAVITLGLGIGATASIFSAVYALLLRPLPYAKAGQLVYISHRTGGQYSDVTLSPDFVAARTRTKSFEQLAGWVNNGDANLVGNATPVRVHWVGITSNFLQVLGVTPQVGRNFLAPEDRYDGPPVILLSNHIWHTYFDANRGIVGETVRLSGRVETVIGVLPPHFSFPSFALEPDVYVAADLSPDTSFAANGMVRPVHAIARLRPGVSEALAQKELQALFDVRALHDPAPYSSIEGNRRIVVESLHRHLTGSDRRPLLLLLACVATVLLIACANVANLQMARATSRRHETTLRGALGASRFRIMRQFLIESLMLSAFAAGLGLAIAYVVAAVVRHVGLPGGVAITVHGLRPFGHSMHESLSKIASVMQVNGWVIGFTVGLALVTTVLFGLVPAVSSARTDLRNALQTAGLKITPGRGQRFLRHVLLIAEAGIAVALLSSAGLLVRSFVNVMQFDSGFHPAHTLTATTLLYGNGYESAGKRSQFVERLQRRLEALPGVEVAAIANAFPLEGVALMRFSADNNPDPPFDQGHVVIQVSATPGYFRATGMQMIQGRTFTKDDSASSQRVVIVNRAFARETFGRNAIGHDLYLRARGEKPRFEPATIVGVVNDVRYNGLHATVAPAIYVPFAQFPTYNVDIVLRTATRPASLTKAMREAVRKVDRNQPVFDIQTMRQRISEMVGPRRLIMLLIGGFAALAVILCAIGVYGVFLYSVSLRTQEMGVRLALGSSRGGLVGLILREAITLIFVGDLAGLGAALVLNRFITAELVGVTTANVPVLALALAMMTLIALLASVFPAVNAARTDLLSVLRAE